MKSVLISIQPKWCHKIVDKEKTFEIRKTRPKIDTPFKCYVYCSAGDYEWRRDCWTTGYETPAGRIKNMSQKVIGEFVCDEIVHIESRGTRYITSFGEAETNRIARESRLDFLDMQKYLGSKDGFAWHISDLVIYDKPKALSEFTKPYGTIIKAFDSKFIESPPQSWCYVEEIK